MNERRDRRDRTAWYESTLGRSRATRLHADAAAGRTHTGGICRDRRRHWTRRRSSSFTQELVRIPSVHDPARGGGEQPAAELVAARMRAFGLGAAASTRSRPAGPTWSPSSRAAAARADADVRGPHRRRHRGRPAAWTVDPFGADILDGRLWGRGSADMKAGAGRDAVRRPGAADWPARSPAGSSSRALVDEEGMMLGAKHFVAARRSAADVDGVDLLRARGRRDLPRRQGRAAAAGRPSPARWPTARCRSTAATRCRWRPARLLALADAASGGCRPRTASTRTSARCT